MHSMKLRYIVQLTLSLFRVRYMIELYMLSILRPALMYPDWENYRGRTHCCGEAGVSRLMAAQLRAAPNTIVL